MRWKCPRMARMPPTSSLRCSRCGAIQSALSWPCASCSAGGERFPPALAYGPLLELADQTTAAEFVVTLREAVVGGRAPHIHPRHHGWVAGYLTELLEHPVGNPFLIGNGNKLSSLLHYGLSGAVQAWVLSTYPAALDGTEPLRPFFAAMTASFIADHYRGSLGDWLHVSPAADMNRYVPWQDTHFGFLDDREFKSSFSRKAGGALVRGVIPEGARVVHRRDGEVFLDAGARFHFQVLRCPLTGKFWPEVDRLQVDDEDWTLDFFRPRAWYGLFSGDPDAAGYLPFHWAAEQVVVDRDPQDPTKLERRWAPVREFARGDA